MFPVSTKLPTDPYFSGRVATPSSDRDDRTQRASRSVMQNSQRQVDVQQKNSVKLSRLPPPVLHAPSSDSDSDELDSDGQSKASFSKLVKKIMYKENRIFDFEEDWKEAGWKGEA